MTDPVLVLIDGECGMCNRVARFLIRRDKNARLRFAALGSAAGARELHRRQLPPPPPGTFVLIEGNRALYRSEGALRVLGLLPPPWAFAKVFLLVPRPLRDAVYDVVARIRYRIAGRVAHCSLLSQDERGRFLPEPSEGIPENDEKNPPPPSDLQLQ